MAKQPKLKTLLEDIFNDKPQINKYEVSEGVRSFGVVGKSLYNNSNIMEIAKQLSHIAEQAHTHVMSETNDWFDKVSVSKNMKSLKGSVVEFKKTAMEANQLNQRLTGLYEDIGHVLNRYYEIDTPVEEGSKEEYEKFFDKAMDKHDISSPADLEGDAEKKDFFNYIDKNYDGETTEAIREFLAKRGNVRETINDPDGLAPDSPDGTGEEMKGESLDPDNTDSVDQPADPAKDGEEMKEIKRSLRDVGGVVGIPALGQIARKFSGK